MPDAGERVLSGDFLGQAASAYWRFITRTSLGVVRVAYASDHQSLVLIARRLVLLRFRSPDYELLADGGSATWRIERGLLVSRDGRDQGFLRMTIQAVDDPESDASDLVRVQVEVRNFYPWIRGSGRFSRFGAWLYGRTQQRLHRWITRGYLRSLARLS